MITKLEIYGIALLVVVCACVGAYFYGRHDGTTIERAKWEADSLKASQQNLLDLKVAITNATTISQNTLDAVGKIKVVNRNITNEVQREVKTNTVYANDCFAPNGLLLWNGANRNVMPSGAAGNQPAAILPGGNGPASAGQQGGNAAAKPR